jgi:N-acetylglucosamine kinase-like BadF-type ATPase
LQLTTRNRRRNRYVIGIDGGASKTIAILGAADGKVLGRGQGGSSNYQNVGSARVIRSIRRAVRGARQQAAIGRRKAEIAVVALAGVDSPKDELAAKRFVRKTKIARRTFVVHDSIAYLQSAFGNRPGIMVESGTGCVAAGVNSTGRYVRVGGWGALFDDHGSGYDIGRRALNAAFRAADGRGPRTKLVPAIKRKFRLKNLEDLVYIIYSTGLTVDETAGLAHLVSKAAPSDEVSRNILQSAGTTLGELACVVAKRLNMNRNHLKVATVGGVFNAGKYLTRTFKKRVKQECPLAEIVKPRIEPAFGAFSLALQKASLKE